MRAPNEILRRYSESQWCEIARTVRDGLDLDADTTTVAGDQHHFHTGSDVDPLPNLPPGEMMLRTALQRIIVFERGGKAPPTVEFLHRAQREADKLRQTLESQHDRYSEELAMLSELSARLGKQIGAQRLARLSRYDSRRAYLLAELVHLWTKLGGKPTGQATENFLQACVEPVLGPTSAKAIGRWIERYHAGEIFFHY